MHTADLGLKATSFISLLSDTSFLPSSISSCLSEKSFSPLKMLRALSGNFPLYAAPLARKIIVLDLVRDEVSNNWGKAAMGVNMAWVNGRVLENGIGMFGCVAFSHSFSSFTPFVIFLLPAVPCSEVLILTRITGFYAPLHGNAFLFAPSSNLACRVSRRSSL